MLCGVREARGRELSSLRRVNIVGLDGAQFLVGPGSYSTRVDDGLLDQESQWFLRSFAEPAFRDRVRAGWSVAVPEEWRRRSARVSWRGESGIRYLAFKKPSGKTLVLEAAFRPLPETIVDELKKHAGSFAPVGAEESSDADEQGVRELGHFPRSEEVGAAAAGRSGGVDAQEREGGAGESGAGDGLEELPGRQEGAVLSEAEESFAQVEIDALAKRLSSLRARVSNTP